MAGVQFVLIGGMAALHADVGVTVDIDVSLRGELATSTNWRWLCAALAPVRAGTNGYDDLRRDKVKIEAADGLRFSSPRLADIVRSKIAVRKENLQRCLG